MNKQSTVSISTRELRKTLGQFTTGVAIVTTRGCQVPCVGMTINSFCSISMEPPLVGWCIDNRAASYEDFLNSQGFTVTVLSSGHEVLAKRFATPGADKFRGIEMKKADLYGIEIPSGCAVFRCRNVTQVRLGDHMLLVGRVEDFRQYARQPLVFHSGAFQQLEKAGCQAA